MCQRPQVNLQYTPKSTEIPTNNHVFHDHFLFSDSPPKPVPFSHPRQK